MGRLYLLRQQFERARQKATCATGKIGDRFAELRTEHLCHEVGYSSWRIELARVAGRLQALENRLVNLAEGVFLFVVLEVHGLIDGVHYLAQ